MRLREVAVAMIAGGALVLNAASCERREAGPAAPAPAGEAAPPPSPPIRPPPLPPPSPPPSDDGGAGGGSATSAGGASGGAEAGRPHARGGSGVVVERGSHAAVGRVKVEGRVARGDVERILREGLPKLKACREGGAGGQ